MNKSLYGWIGELNRQAAQEAQMQINSVGLPLNPSQLMVLAAVCVKGPMRPSDLARFTGYPATSFTPTLDSLCLGDDPFLVRTDNLRDRRAVTVSLAERGERERGVIIAAYRATEDSLRAIIDQAVSELPVLTPEAEPVGLRI
jgi:DNA-binding MarR family transcriptional regulator